ncbi:MAG: nicotinate-nucleotide adenylyltransferase [Verrucomicrobia bacterium]|nr:MAG: nicotinate-nucleotide adenylyltransferase [Verrucomicrobiota bacterium]
MNGEFDLQVNKKAFQINRDERLYGTFAEIGAGQEVARRFFHVGRASGTIAKTMSAYDMTFSDSIYGASARYVSRQRLNTMLEHEYGLLLERLDEKMGDKRMFFVFANTVAARSFRRHEESHGWMGIRFQSSPRSQTSEIIVHVRMLDTKNILQQDALGIIGVNLIYGAFFLRHRPEALVASLMDDLSSARLEVDMIQFSGSEFSQVDNRIMSLQLVSQGLTKAAMFRADGKTIQPSEILYKNALLVERGSFRPLTLIANDILNCGHAMFLKDARLEGAEPYVLMEITMQNLLQSGELDLHDFLDRVDVLGSLGRTVLISNYGEYYRLVNYLTRYTDRPVALPVGIPSLEDIFQEKYYENLEGGILEGLGRLFKNGVRLFVYPKSEKDGRLVTALNFQVAPNLRHLYRHLIESKFIVPIENFRPEYLNIRPPDVLRGIRDHDGIWESKVPPKVVALIKERRLFGY